MAFYSVYFISVTKKFLLFGQELNFLGTTFLSSLRLKEIAPSEQL